MKEKTKTVKSWDELVKFISSINPYKRTLVLTGFTNELDGEKLLIRELIFSTTDIKILKHGDKNTEQSKTKRI